MPGLRVVGRGGAGGGGSDGRRARAESAEAQVERLAADAVNAYRGADYNRAVELLTRAYEIRQVPALLYNLAKAYDKLGDVEHAYDAYRRYADSADADPKLKAKSEARLAVLEEARRKKAAAQRAVEPKPQRRRGEHVAAAAGAGRAACSRRHRRRSEIKEHLKRRAAARCASAIATSRSGSASARSRFAGVAVGLSVSALQLQSQWSARVRRRRSGAARAQGHALTRAAIADGFYAGDRAAAAVGAYFLYRGFRPEPTAPSLALAAAWRRRRASALVAAGRF